mgnify:CR=1 FL=1|tara:strand:- start:117 stop:548 length:432 start_codon:yes stop_codon:yes gene_type:complete
MLLKTAAATLTASVAMVALIGTAANAQSNRIGTGWAGQAHAAAQRTGNAARFCNFTDTISNTWLSRDEFACSVTSYINSNGHTVWSVSTHDLTTEVLLWDDGTAEFWQDGARYTAIWSNNHGYTEIHSDDRTASGAPTYSFRF